MSESGGMSLYGDGDGLSYEEEQDLWAATTPEEFDEAVEQAYSDELLFQGVDFDNDAQRAEKEALIRVIVDHGLEDLIKNLETVLSAVRAGNPTQQHLVWLNRLGNYSDSNAHAFKKKLYKWFPLTEELWTAYTIWYNQTHLEVPEGENRSEYILDQIADAFSRGSDSASGFEMAFGYLDTQVRLGEIFNEHIRENVAPLPVFPWECRIGASRFVVPPLNINVSQQGRAGSLTGGALRQQIAPKFNSGHSETMITMTLYFPNQESIWGGDMDATSFLDSSDGEKIDINFDADGNEEEVDRFLSSLRGLVAQFKYAPFLPIKNQYLNQTWDITGVVLQSMTISTVEDFPFCVAVNLNLLKFNHKAYLPMIHDFNNAIHWGKYRQYMGRAAKQLAASATQGFLIEKEVSYYGEYGIFSERQDSMVEKIDPNNPEDAMQTVPAYEHEIPTSFNKKQEWLDGKNFNIYYPIKTPLQVFGPDLANFRQPGENEDFDAVREKSWWESFLGAMNIDVDTAPGYVWEELGFDTLSSFSQRISASELSSTRSVLHNYLRDNSLYGNPSAMSLEKMAEWQGFYRNLSVLGTGSSLTDAAIDKLNLEAALYWFDYIFNNYKTTPYFQAYLEDAMFKDSHLTIREWEVPMARLPIDWSKVIVNGVSVTIANNIARLQLQMQEEPVHQHIGGRDSRIDVSMTVFGEEELIRLKQAYNHVNNLARLEHAHGVLGFMGVKNVLTALAGIKYVLPLAFEVDTIPGFPRVYSVRLSFTDFDVKQQMREQLSSEQQKELVEAFGKRNPFLRIKQLWGAFNAYPDFPLSVKDEDGKIVGHLDPDYYFHAFQTIDDDIVQGSLQRKEATTGYEALANYLGVEDSNKTTPIEDYTPSVSHLTRELDLGLGEVATIQDRTAEGYSHKYKLNLGVYDKDMKSNSIIELDDYGWAFGKEDIDTGQTEWAARGINVDDDIASRVQVEPTTPTADTAPFASYGHPYEDKGTANPNHQFHLMMQDAQYRDLSGRMVRAFPTYMLWLIDEGGYFTGVKLFDNFYGLQSVIDFSIVQSEDILGDTLILRVSNLYSKLSSEYKAVINGKTDTRLTDEEEPDMALAVIDTIRDAGRNLMSGTVDSHIVEIENIRLKPGVRVHLRMGYSANPNALPTVFNGVVTTVETGDIITITCQSDAIELSPIINTTDKKGHSGDMNEGFMGSMWLSEPRDLMVRLLSMGASGVKEQIAHAFKGQIFSESRFGIRHFGHILYEPMSDGEEKRHADRYEIVKNNLQQFTGDLEGNDPVSSLGEAFGGLTSFFASGGDGTGTLFSSLAGEGIRSPAIDLMQNMWANFVNRRDYELFKRNIYPGNGLGVAQYLGGDLMDGALTMAATHEGRNSKTPQETRVFDGLSAQAQANATIADVQSSGEDDDARALRNSGLDPNEVAVALDGGDINTATDPRIFEAVRSRRENHPFMKALGLTNSDDDVNGFDEVSFRAQTYMKSVWDLFRLCAALLPNYIVAVRPFEDRSTVFYGKPHWLYTSGVIPLTTGIPKSSTLKVEDSNEELERMLQNAAGLANPLADLKNEMQFYENLEKSHPFSMQQVQPNGSVDVPDWALREFKTLPLYRDESTKKVLLPHRTGSIVEEMHLPTSSSLEEDMKQHQQSSTLPPEKRHPFYMDRSSDGSARGQQGGVGGVHGNNEYSEGGTIKEGDNPDWPGRTGFFGVLDPESERWYMNMYWDSAHVKRDELKGSRILVFNANNGRACVCTPGDKGPSPSTGHHIGVSPDVAEVLGIKNGDTNIWVGFVDDNSKLGPVTSLASSGITGIDSSGRSPGMRNADREGGQEAIADSSDEEIELEESSDGNTYSDGTFDWFDEERADSAGLYEFEQGGLEENVPVYINRGSGLYQDDKTQNIGYLARLLYDEEFAERENSTARLIGKRTVDEAEEIWDQFRKEFQDYDSVEGEWEKITLENHEDNEDLYGEYIEEFKKWLWQDPWRRAWVVVVVSRKVDKGQLFTDNSIEALGDTGELFDFTPDAIFGGEGWKFNRVEKLWKEYMRIKHSTVEPMPISAFEQELKAWMEQNASEGDEADSLLGAALEDIDQALDATIGKLLTAVSAGLSGLVSMFRMSMMTMGQGLNMVGSMQKQANLLNKVFNDSIYFKAGEEGSILRLADNPFTREYGEPVVEVREPFQRMHYINSFQHIISNQIEENSNVATVVTATSDGKYPVTVHMDKGAPPERQTEIAVETGLFWDNAKGSGILGFLHPLLHPIETARSIAKVTTGSADEMLSKRVALWHLKENLKDIYSGEIILLGNPDIRPHDLIYIADIYERCYGMFEVEQVVHHFTPDQGFITSVTPNAIVTINDPARWSMISWIWSWWAVKNMRDDVRQIIDKTQDAESYFVSEKITSRNLAEVMRTQMYGHLQYTQGSSALVKDLASASQMGLVNVGALGNQGGGLAEALLPMAATGLAPVVGAGAGFLLGGGPAGAVIGGVGGLAAGDLAWDAWKWVRDNLLDQHGCYIQYLNKDGKPMDAGLSYAQGVAVGRHHSINLLPGILGVRVNTQDQHGNSFIRSDDLLSALGWKPIDITRLVREVSWWNAQTQVKIMEMAGRTPDEIALNKPEVEIGTVVDIEDGDTIDVETEHGRVTVRLTGINTAELQIHDRDVYELDYDAITGENMPFQDPQDEGISSNRNSARSVLATAYLKKILIDDPKAAGYEPTVALRYNRYNKYDSTDSARLLAVVFHNVPQGTPPGDRDTVLRGLAEKHPLIAWDSYMEDSRPYTANWAMVMSGLATIYFKDLLTNDTERGADAYKD